MALPTEGRELSLVVDGISVEYRARKAVKGDGSADDSNDTEDVERAEKPQRQTHRKNSAPTQALKDVSFIACAGDSIGLLGGEGSGRTTLLRTLANLERTTSGTILAKTQPRLVGIRPVLNQNLSGTRNIELACYSLGLSPARAKKVMPKILEIAGLTELAAQPLKTYSALQAERLRYAIMAIARPKIMLIDGTVGKADSAFRRNSYEVFAEMTAAGGTFIWAAPMVKSMVLTCERGIWLHEGQVVCDMSMKDVARRFNKWNSAIEAGKEEQALELVEAARAEYLESNVAVLARMAARGSKRRMKR